MEQCVKRVAFIAMVAGMLIIAGSCNKNDDKPLRNEQFVLAPAGNSGISGVAYIAENLDSSFNVIIRLNSSIKDSVHVMNIYNVFPNGSNSVAIKLTDIKGTGGAVVGETKNIKQTVEDTGNFGSTSYDKVLGRTSVIMVLLSSNRPDSVLCAAEIGR